MVNYAEKGQRTAELFLAKTFLLSPHKQFHAVFFFTLDPGIWRISTAPAEHLFGCVSFKHRRIRQLKSGPSVCFLLVPLYIYIVHDVKNR